MTRTYGWLITVVLAVLVAQWAVAVLASLLPELAVLGGVLGGLSLLVAVRRRRRERW